MNRVAPTRSRWPASQRLFLWRKDALHAPQRHVRTSARRSRVATRRLGDIPVAVLKPDGTGVQIDAIHTDHLNTPRMLVDANGQVRWRWLGEPFGASPAEEQPTAGLAPVQQQLRFPGQQYEAFGGRHYNHFRDYDPTVGRYVQSDPIGLDGGVNTYEYVESNPLTYVDSEGLFAWGIVFGGADLAWQLYQNGGKLRCVNWVDVGMSTLGGGLLNALGKGAFRFKRGAEWLTKSGRPRNPHSWDATSKWMNKERIQTLSAGQNRHHWLLERNQGIGKNMPDWLKNQPWNTNPISQEFNNWLSRRPALAPLGAPSWVPEVLGGGAVATVGSACGCP